MRGKSGRRAAASATPQAGRSVRARARALQRLSATSTARAGRVPGGARSRHTPGRDRSRGSRPGAGRSPHRPPQQPGRLPLHVCETRPSSPWQGAHDDVDPRRYAAQLGTRDRTQATSHPIANRCVADRLGHDKTDPRRSAALRVGHRSMDHEEGPATSGASWTAHCRSELRGVTQSMPCRQHTMPQAESSARPLRRRPAMIARPARVLIRARKPCVLARRRVLGWKVRLLTVDLRQAGQALGCARCGWSAGKSAGKSVGQAARICTP